MQSVWGVLSGRHRQFTEIFLKIRIYNNIQLITRDVQINNNAKSFLFLNVALLSVCFFKTSFTFGPGAGAIDFIYPVIQLTDKAFFLESLSLVSEFIVIALPLWITRLMI